MMDPIRCTKCARVLKEPDTVWLELSMYTGEYHSDGEVPPEQSQGSFPFGKDCARKEVASPSRP